ERLQPACVQSRPEHDVVDRGQLLVHAGDEVRLDSRDRQRTGRDVGRGHVLFICPAASVEQSHGRPFLRSAGPLANVPPAEFSDYTFARNAETSFTALRARTNRGAETPPLQSVQARVPRLVSTASTADGTPLSCTPCTRVRTFSASS